MPSYGPDLNPIEKMWVQVKSVRKKFRVKAIDSYNDKQFHLIHLHLWQPQ